MYAVINSGGKQHRVTPGETLRVETIAGAAGDSVTFEDVLLVAGDETLHVGAPIVEGAEVSGRIVEHGKHRKLRVFTYKRRKGARRRLGHRQQYTLVEITGIKAP